MCVFCTFVLFLLFVFYDSIFVLVFFLVGWFFVILVFLFLVTVFCHFLCLNPLLGYDIALYVLAFSLYFFYRFALRFLWFAFFDSFICCCFSFF